MPTETVINIQREQSPPNASNPAAQNGKNEDTGLENLFSWIQMNTHYFKTTPGVVKIIAIFIGVICIFLASPPRSPMVGGAGSTPVTQWFLFIVIISLIATVIWIFVYFLSVREALSFPINWPLSEMINMGLLSLMYIIVSVIQIESWVAAHNAPHRISNIVAGVFGVLNTLVYIFAAYLSYDEWKHTHTIH